MPTYEYRCDAGHQYEKREGFDAPARQKCQKCSRIANRLLFAPPVVFKGSGFYKTDNRGSSSSLPDSTPTAAPAATTNGTADAGHSHGPGGHSHDTPSSEPSTESAAAS